MTFEMPKREACDGPVGVHAMRATAPPHEDRGIAITGMHEGTVQTIAVSRYNAARILVMLCLMLEVKMPKEIAKMPM